MRARLAATRTVARGYPVHLGGSNSFQEEDELESTFFESKRLVGVNKSDTAGIDSILTRLPKKSVRMHNHEKTTTHLVPDPHCPVLLSRSPLIFVFGFIKRARHHQGDAKVLQQGRRTHSKAAGANHASVTLVTLSSRDELCNARGQAPGPVLEKAWEQFSATPELSVK